MFCPNCGNAIDDTATFCPKCGTAVSSYAQPAQPAEPQVYADPQPQDYVNPGTGYTDPYQQPYQPGFQQSFAPQLPMKWFKFLIYFSLFASALLNVIGGITMLTGATYGEYADYVYSYFDGLKALDVILGIACIALAVMAIYTRVRLAGYYKNGPQMLMFFYIAVVALNLIQTIAYNVVLSDFAEYIDYTSAISQIITGIVLIIVNNIYFKKRESMFTK